MDLVKIQAMDASHVSLVKAEMDTSAFISRPRVYSPETETSIGINLNQLAKALRCADPDDRVVLLSDSDPRVGRVYVYIYRPNPRCPGQSFFEHLYDEGTFADCFHNGDPNRRLRVRLTKRDVPVDMLPMKETVLDLPKVFVDEPAIGVPPSPPGYTIRIPSRVFRDVTTHLTSLADTLDISVFLEQGDEVYNEENEKHDMEPVVKVRHKVVFSSMYEADLGGRHELRSRLKWMGVDDALDLLEGVDGPEICVRGSRRCGSDDMHDTDSDTDTESVEEPGEKLRPQLLITQSYASRYLETFAAAAGISGTVLLHMSEDSPIQVRYERKRDGLRMVYYLAPKIDE